MFEQSFAFSDIPRIFMLAFLELLLSTDNALVLGAISHSLPPPQRRKALFIGLASAFVLRAAALILVALLFENIWIQLAGSAYLIYLSCSYFAKTKKPLSPASHSFWKTVLLIELLDIVFAFDSIIAGVAFIDDSFSKLWIVYAGGMIGLIGMRFAATLFSNLIDKFPRLETSAYLLVGWIGLKLAAAALGHPLPPIAFWGVGTTFFLFGFTRKP